MPEISDKRRKSETELEEQLTALRSTAFSALVES